MLVQAQEKELQCICRWIYLDLDVAKGPQNSFKASD